jgi:hypothetical protein
MTNMNFNTLKTTGMSFALAAAFLVTAGSSNAFAQDGRGRDRGRDGVQDNRRERDGMQDNRRERGDWQDNRRERFEERRGYRDGLIQGRQDAFERRRFNPFSSPRSRFGSSDYREGFRSGYTQAYRQFANNRGYRYGRSY